MTTPPVQPAFDRTSLTLEAGARASAQALLPDLLSRLAARSVLQVGCGTGAWLAVALDLGVDDVVGIDDTACPPEAMRVGRDRVQQVDFARGFDLGRRFDVVLCVDLVPRLPTSSFDALAAALVGHGDVVVVATASPGKEGRTSLATSLACHGLLPIANWPAVPSRTQVAPWHARDLALYATAEASARLARGSTSVPRGDAGPSDAAEATWRPCLPPGVALGNEPKVAVVIPCHNYARFLPDAVASVVAQTWRPLQCVVVDDGSTDDTAALVLELSALHPSLDLRLVRQRNQGVAQARNHGVRATDAPLVMQLDADDRLRPDAVAQLVAAFLRDPGLGIAHCDAREFGASHRPLPAAADVTLARLRRGNAMNYCALVRRTVFRFLCGYRDIRGGYDDWDLWLSAAAAGFRFGHVPQPLLLYRRHGKSLMDRERAREAVLRAQVVANHPDVYSPRQTARARELLTRDALGQPLGSLLQQAWDLLGERRLRRAWRTLRPVTT